MTDKSKKITAISILSLLLIVVTYLYFFPPPTDSGPLEGKESVLNPETNSQLSSFEFESSLDTSGWQTYVSSLGFSVKYPPDLLNVNDKKDNSGQSYGVDFSLKTYDSTQPFQDQTVFSVLPDNSSIDRTVKAIKDLSDLGKELGREIKVDTQKCNITPRTCIVIFRNNGTEDLNVYVFISKSETTTLWFTGPTNFNDPNWPVFSAMMLSLKLNQ